ISESSHPTHIRDKLQKIGNMSAFSPASKGGKGERSVGEFSDVGRLDLLCVGQRTSGVCSAVLVCPPTTGQSGSRDDADYWLIVFYQGDKSGPYRHTADKIFGSVYRIDDPAAFRSTIGPEFFTGHSVARPGTFKLCTDEFLGGAVSI